MTTTRRKHQLSMLKHNIKEISLTKLSFDFITALLFLLLLRITAGSDYSIQQGIRIEL